MVPDTAFAQLLNSNVAPDTLEAASVQLLVNDLAIEISRLKLRLADLEDQHRGHSAILSPVRRVPLETLGDIFMLAMPSPLVLDHAERDRLLQLCLVCRSWRQAALLASPLWGGVEVTPEYTYAYDKTVCWLDRSGGSRRTFVFKEAASPFGSIRRCLRLCGPGACMLDNLLLSRLLRDGPTIDELRLQCTARCFRNWSASLKPSASGLRPWDGLRSLYLDVDAVTGWEDYDFADSKESSFLHLPAVSNLTLVLPSFSWLQEQHRGSAVILLPHGILEQLTSLELHCDWDGLHLSQTLEKCANIESLSLTCGYQGNERFMFPSPLRLPNVRSLRVQQLGYAPSMLYHLVTPALVDLHLEDFRFMFLDHGEKFRAMLAWFLQNSSLGQQLQRLRLDDAMIADGLLMSLLVSLPSLKHLALRYAIPRGVDNSGGVWKMLREAAAVDGGQNNYLPSLTTIELLRVEVDYKFQHLIDWVHARPAELAPCHISGSYSPPSNQEGATEQMMGGYQFDVLHDWQGPRAIRVSS